jgi:tRNA nucleotidyltransferase (CCA-adding enzyme)
MITIAPSLEKLATLYANEGHQLVFVGGCVRDSILGIPYKDIDLATSATPEEQVDLFEKNGIRWVGTGLKHGTITVVSEGDVYEITTFRTDVETNGRHAVVAYTRDLMTDLERRDLTINAIAMRFDGEIIDPFSGGDDVKAGLVRFVGDPDKRIKEDYLRILRYFRFLGRVGKEFSRESADALAIQQNVRGLTKISYERIWLEMAKILTGPQSTEVVTMMSDLGVLAVLDIDKTANFETLDRLEKMKAFRNSPATLMAMWQGTAAVRILAKWKASNAEVEEAAFVSNAMRYDYTLAQAKEDVLSKVDRDWVASVLLFQGKQEEAAYIASWEVPMFPIRGKDLLDRGMEPNKQMGDKMKELKASWASSDYTKTREELLQEV